MRKGLPPRRCMDICWWEGTSKLPPPPAYSQFSIASLWSPSSSPAFTAGVSTAWSVMTRFRYASCKSPRPNWRRWISGGGAAALPFLRLVFVGQNACTSHACPGSRHSGTNLSLAVTLNLGCDSFSLRCCLSLDPHRVSGLLFKRKLRSSLGCV